MKDENIEVFEKAFNELSDEGFFKDFTAKVRRLQVKTKIDTKKWKAGIAAGIRHTGLKNGGGYRFVSETVLVRAGQEEVPGTVLVPFLRKHKPYANLMRVGRRNIHSTVVVHSLQNKVPDTIFVRTEQQNAPKVILVSAGRKSRRKSAFRQEHRTHAGLVEYVRANIEND